ncbi:alpha-galactosidase [Paenibacillus sp. BIHB 4019]|uniref:Alpha-galactosidase n=1 Tax=Paenibacillus sp. BIHB 4019 TaxID=1870819 RepID=A0A1B2DSV7_9BACL|nr:glycoside hydrolase family 27 protein [Paenibacillus sp. BIHB 4019]ANY70802.1 alpha-galactosidase [Paenibacillus sp. BIHB 4019]
MKHHELAVTPPMGWNSWDCYGASVKEEEVRANARYMAEHLKPFGWEYVVVDIQWYEPGAYSSSYRPFVPLEMDEYSRLLPAVNRFPSAADGQGFKPLSEYVHSLGLKFGIHIMRGIPRQAAHADTKILGTDATARSIAQAGDGSICPWNTDMYGVNTNKDGAQQYYNSLFELYASWGVDFVKVDDIAASRLYGIRADEISMIRQAIDSCGRPMVLSLSPGPAPVEHAEELTAGANMWRITDDYWDLWHLLYEMFERCEKWAPHVGPGHWPDCDMLPLGHLGIRSVDGGGADRWTRFTRDEQVTMMSLWSIFRSPLMFGGELNDNDEWTLSLLTNKEVLALHQNSRDARQVYRDSADRIVWTAGSAEGEGTAYVALFNAGDEAAVVSVSLSQLGLDGTRSVRDVWQQEKLGQCEDSLSYQLAPHASLLLKLTI